jgi:hypothetical protein
MIFTVAYAPTAEVELTEAWIHAADRKVVENASNLVDRLLRVDAHLRGQPFFGDRIFVLSPLAVTFSVSVDDRLVTVLQVQMIG